MNIHTHLPFFSLGGFTLPPSQRLSLPASLQILKSSQRFNEVRFIGRLNGIQATYYLAVGVSPHIEGASTQPSQVLFYSLDGVTWLQLESPEEWQRQYLQQIRGYFMGDPSFVYVFDREHDVPEEEEEPSQKPVTNEEEAGEDEEEKGEENPEDDDQPKKPTRPTTQIKEETRLAFFLEAMLFDTSIAPRGAYMKNSKDQIVLNPMFEGLTLHESGKLKNYIHLREAVRQKSPIELDNSLRALDFGDKVDQDVPSRSWTVQYDESLGSIVGKSLLWPGYVFYHIPNSNVFGSFYNGNGNKNYDLCFMLRQITKAPRNNIKEEEVAEPKIVTSAQGDEEEED